MMRKRNYFVWLSLVLFLANCRAYIYDIRVMRKWEPACNQFCYFIGLGDFHDKKHTITPLQLQQIDQIAAKLQPNKTKLIIEDISSENNIGKKGCGRFFVNSRGGILGGLAKKFRGKKFPYVDNVEYRFCRVASLAPVVHNINANLRRFLSTAKIYKRCLSREISLTAKEIIGYQDGNVLNSWYKKCILTMRNNMKLLKFDKKPNTSVADFIYSMTTPKNRFNFVKKLLVFDSPLIDAKIIHSIVAPPKKQHSFVIAGGSHIKNVSRVLQQIGYKPIYQSSVVVEKEYDKKKCLGCNVLPGGFCCKPRPADLHILNKFI